MLHLSVLEVGDVSGKEAGGAAPQHLHLAHLPLPVGTLLPRTVTSHSHFPSAAPLAALTLMLVPQTSGIPGRGSDFHRD